MWNFQSRSKTKIGASMRDPNFWKGQSTRHLAWGSWRYGALKIDLDMSRPRIREPPCTLFIQRAKRCGGFSGSMRAHVAAAGHRNPKWTVGGCESCSVVVRMLWSSISALKRAYDCLPTRPECWERDFGVSLGHLGLGAGSAVRSLVDIGVISGDH